MPTGSRLGSSTDDALKHWHFTHLIQLAWLVCLPAAKRCKTRLDGRSVEEPCWLQVSINCRKGTTEDGLSAEVCMTAVQKYHGSIGSGGRQRRQTRAPLLTAPSTVLQQLHVPQC